MKYMNKWGAFESNLKYRLKYTDYKTINYEFMYKFVYNKYIGDATIPFSKLPEYMRIIVVNNSLIISAADMFMQYTNSESVEDGILKEFLTSIDFIKYMVLEGAEDYISAISVSEIDD